MRTELCCLLICSLIFITGMRDPFHPPDDRCSAGTLAHWRYQGLIENGNSVGIVKDEQQRWHRVRQQEKLPAGWLVLAVNEMEMVVGLGEECEPKEWRWQREGTNNENRKNRGSAGDVQPADAGHRAETRHAGGG
ncbi:HofP DNA utilization family protein [Lelliottia aquatilis]|uniref:HofP DNA utilization family protein n=1 Tax=Lelliottia aquatilis TaxID=2080838 RepID=UPI001575ADDF|nr:HofP DNA utilization family protein [Lelliottia aquatilis]